MCCASPARWSSSRNHPLAQAVVRAAKDDQLDLPAAGPLENVAGKGIKSSVAGKPVWIGA